MCCRSCLQDSNSTPCLLKQQIIVQFMPLPSLTSQSKFCTSEAMLLCVSKLATRTTATDSQIEHHHNCTLLYLTFYQVTTKILKQPAASAALFLSLLASRAASAAARVSSRLSLFTSLSSFRCLRLHIMPSVSDNSSAQCGVISGAGACQGTTKSATSHMKSPHLQEGLHDSVLFGHQRRHSG